MGKLLEELRKFLSTATPEQLEQAWKEVEQFKDIGPTLDEFIENSRKFCSVSPNCDNCYRKDNCLME